MAKLENNLPYFILRIADCSRIHCSKLEDGGWMVSYLEPSSCVCLV